MKKNEAYEHTIKIVEQLVNANIINNKSTELYARGIIQIYLEDKVTRV